MKFKNLECDACKEYNPSVKSIIEEISNIVGTENKTIVPNTILSITNESSNNLNGLLDEFIPMFNEFLTVPFEGISVDQLVLEDQDKKIKNILVSSLSDVPGLDISKVIDISKYNIEKLTDLKFSLSIPTITFEMKILTVDMKFAIDRSGFHYYPILDLGIKNREDAILKLSGIKTKQPISYSTDLIAAKNIAISSYPSSLEVNNIVANSNTTQKLIESLSLIGVVLFDTIDVQTLAQNFLTREEQYKSSEPLNCDTCGSIGISTPMFSSEELIEIEKLCCSQDKPIPTNVDNIDIINNDNIDKQLLSLDDNYDIDSDLAVSDLKVFLDDIKSKDSVIQSCSIERQNAQNNYYWYFETNFLNTLVLEYAAVRSLTYDSLIGSNDTLKSEKARLQKLNIFIQEEIDNFTLDAYNRIFNSQISDIMLIKSTDLINIQKDNTYINNVIYLKKDIAKNNNKIDTINSQLDIKNNINFVSSLTPAEIISITNVTTGVTGSTFSIKDRVDSYRSIFLKSNTITNQAGFDVNGNISISIHPNILTEANTIFALNSLSNTEITNYLTGLTSREGLVSSELWNKYYSSKMIDNLFTYQEQGYLSPKPQFDSKGNHIGDTTTVTVKDSNGKTVEQQVSSDIANLKIDDKISNDFWPNLDIKIKNKIFLILSKIQESTEYIEYVDKLHNAAKNEAMFLFSVNKLVSNTVQSSKSPTPSVNIVFNLLDNIKPTYESVSKFQINLIDKLNALDLFIEKKKQCVSLQEKAISDSAISYMKTSALKYPQAVATNNSINTPVKEDCSSLLGSDPLSSKLPENCPGISKDCYWKEYTNILQKVSLMPIPDDIANGSLTKRLFRYYPVFLQIPLPVPPGILPTLASGIPDPLISIPLPFIWKHIVTITTPVGILVVWIALCGAIPCPFVMYIDEKLIPCFLISPKGPIALPANSLTVTPDQKIPLIEYLTEIKNIFRVDVLLDAFMPMIGSNGKIKSTNPDHSSNVIDKIIHKLKNAIASIKVSDPWAITLSDNVKIKDMKKRVYDSLKNCPPDIEAIRYILDKIGESLNTAVESLNISPIKFPSNTKKLATNIIGPKEFGETFKDLIDAGTSLASLGLGNSMVSFHTLLTQLLLEVLDDPIVRKEFIKINQEITNLELSYVSKNFTFKTSDKFTQRAAKFKKALLILVNKVCSIISPEKLGFNPIANISIPLPEPCYQDITLELVPPYIEAMIIIINQLPGIIETLPDEQFGILLSKHISLDNTLSTLENSIKPIISALLDHIPDHKYPNMSTTHFKQIISTIAQCFFKIKARVHPGGVQFEIPSTLIKEAIESCVQTGYNVLKNMILIELEKASIGNDTNKILAIAAIIKAAFSTDLSSISGNDIKAYLVSILSTIENSLETIKSLLIDLPIFEFESIKTIIFPTLDDALDKILNPSGMFLEIGTIEMQKLTRPILDELEKNPIPFAAILLFASQTPSRSIITKLHPFYAYQVLPSWEGLSTNNIPFIVWLDQLAATAQRQGGLCSDYVIPYWLPDI